MKEMPMIEMDTPAPRLGLMAKENNMGIFTDLAIGGLTQFERLQKRY